MPVTYKSRSTLVPPPETVTPRAEIENVLELTQLGDIDPDLYTNTRPLLHPPGARGIYGGAVIAQCLAAAQNTVPPRFWVHSMHCYFVMAGNASIPVIYHVEHVRQGRSFAVRTVQARQRGRVIFTTTCSFVKENSGGQQKLEHSMAMPFVPGPTEDTEVEDLSLPHSIESPVVSQRIDIFNNDSPLPSAKKTRQWIKVSGSISEEGGHGAHLAALAYMSDSYFIGTVSRVHKLWRIPRRMPREEREGTGATVTAATKHGDPKPEEGKTVDTIAKVDTVTDDDVLASLRSAESRAGTPERLPEPQKEVGMMVSLDHAIYFHDPRGFRADEWIFTEMESPWSGDGRGLVMQRMWTRSGRLIATCVQEGVVRLKQDAESAKL